MWQVEQGISFGGIVGSDGVGGMIGPGVGQDTGKGG